MEVTRIDIPAILLEWTEWYPWPRFLSDARSDPFAINVPEESGVYEAAYQPEGERLAIGRASSLRMRVKQGLVKGKTAHSSGRRIRVDEDTSRIIIRWAVTNGPAAAEEELHYRHVALYCQLPKYAETT